MDYILHSVLLFSSEGGSTSLTELFHKELYRQPNNLSSPQVFANVTYRKWLLHFLFLNNLLLANFVTSHVKVEILKKDANSCKNCILYVNMNNFSPGIRNVVAILRKGFDTLSLLKFMVWHTDYGRVLLFLTVLTRFIMRPSRKLMMTTSWSVSYYFF